MILLERIVFHISLSVGKIASMQDKYRHVNQKFSNGSPFLLYVIYIIILGEQHEHISKSMVIPYGSHTNIENWMHQSGENNFWGCENTHEESEQWFVYMIYDRINGLLLLLPLLLILIYLHTTVVIYAYTKYCSYGRRLIFLPLINS